MKCQDLFSLKSKKEFRLSSAANFPLKGLSHYFKKDLIICCPIFWGNKYYLCVTPFLKKYYSYAQNVTLFSEKNKKIIYHLLSAIFTICMLMSHT